MRVGIGYDVHRLVEGLPFWLGGVQVAHTKGAKGHSDADALIHAICDALLGALALGDIGTHFPDTDPSYRGISSRQLLARVVRLVEEAQYTIGNIDTTICLEVPKLTPHIPAMRHALADVMGLSPAVVSIKATTNERLGFIGQKQGIACYAVALLFSKTFAVSI